MFDRCRGWRQKLSRRAEGSLSFLQQVGLDHHLAHCESCRLAAEADNALHETLRLPFGASDPDGFDDRVLSALRASPPSPTPARAGLAAVWRWRQMCRENLPFSFLTQIAGGGLVAASVTMLCVLSSLHPETPSETSGGLNSARTLAAPEKPPIPLESLLRSASPRAALLWPAPADHNIRPTFKRAGEIQPASPSGKSERLAPRPRKPLTPLEEPNRKSPTHQKTGYQDRKPNIESA